MALVTRPSSAAYTALVYVTAGALTDVWSGVWYVYLTRYPPDRDWVWYICYAFLLTGLVLLLIGLFLGRLGRAARHAELPPPEVTPAVARAQQEAAARAPIIATTNPAVPPGTPTPATAPPAVAVPVNQAVAAPPRA